MGASVRRQAADIYTQITRDGAYANLALAHGLERAALQGRDRAFITNLVYGALRHDRQLEYQISQFLKKRPKAKDAYLLSILKIGVFELLYSAAAPHAVVNEWVTVARTVGHEGWSRVTNGVLRNVLRQKDALVWPQFDDPLSSLAFQYSLPEWLAERWRRELGEEETQSLLATFAQEPPLCLRVDPRRTNRAALLAKLQGQGCAAEPCLLSPNGLRLPTGSFALLAEGLRAGDFVIQEEAAQLPPYILAPRDGEKILDMCAAPGGKAAYLASLADCQVVAADIYPHKLELIAEARRRLRLTNLETTLRDGREWGTAQPLAFDAVLLDAPCSGLGVMNRRPDSRLRKQESDIAELAALQRELLLSAVGTLKQGGRLVYSTCTVSREENEDNCRWLLEECPELSPLPFDGAPTGQRQYLPERDNTDGFFIAAFRKRGCQK